MDGEHKDYLYKNEISLSIGDDSVDSSVSTPSTVTPTIPTPSPRQNAADDKKPLTKQSGNMSKPDGIDNKAFEATEKSPGKPLTSFGNGHSNNLNESGANGANKNGQLNEKKLAEAVNLELININNNAKKPTNGKHNNNDLPAKKDGDVEVGNTRDDSYDEYFVPVNKHRKYMGGEKLYVTQDKRSKSNKNKLCWIICIGLVAAVILLGILAATGLFSSSESPVEARNLKSTGNDSVAVAGFGGSSGLSQQPDSTTTSSTTASTSPPIIDTTLPPDVISYVPNTLEGQITLSNAEYSDEYNDPNSPIYKKLIKDLEYELKNALSQNGDEEFFIKIIGLKSGSVVVDYRVSWKNPNSEMTSDEMMSRIQSFLQKNNQQFMSRYLVNLNAVRTARVPDRCASSDKNHCDYGCEFSAEMVDFMCTCAADMKYDNDFKECVSADDSIYSDNSPVGEPEPAGEPGSGHEHDHSHHDHHHHGHESTSEPSSEPKSEPEPTGEPSSEPEPTSEPKSEPEPTSEPKSEPEPTKDHDHHEHHEHHFIYDNAGTKKEESKEPKAEPEPTGEPSSEPEPTSEPKSEPEPTKDHDHHEHHEHHFIYDNAGTKKEESKEPKAEPEPTGEPSSEPEPTSEPKSEPEPTKDHDHHLIYDNAGTKKEDSKDPKAEPEPSSEPEPTSEPKSTAEPSSEPKSEPEPSSDKNDKDTVHHDHHLIYNNAGVSSTEPSAEPKAEPEPTSEPEPSKDSEGSKSETIYTGDKKSKLLEETAAAQESTSSKPVSEDFDDTPRPTESYFALSRGKDLKNDVNIFDMNSTTQSSSNSTIYSTATPIHLWLTENATHAEHANESHDMSPFLPAAESPKNQEKPVTENVLESEAPHNQSPFLPELENNETLHHILHGAHGMVMSDESDEANKTFSITVSYSNETHTDSPIVKIDSINSSTQSSNANAESTTTASEVQITSEAAAGSTTIGSILIGGVLTESSVAAESSTASQAESTTESTTTTTVKSDDDEDSGEDESQNLFGETVEKDDEHEDVTTIPESSTVANATSESTTEASNIQVLTTHSDASTESTTKISGDSSSQSPVSETTTTSASNESTTQAPLILVSLSVEQSQTTTSTEPSTSQAPLTTTSQSPISEIIVKTAERALNYFDSESSTTVPQTTTSTEASTSSFAETSTTVSIKVHESNEDQKSKVTLETFTHFEDSNSLKVLPLTPKETPSTTTEPNVRTSENEITEKTETTGHFLEQTTFPSIKSESDEASHFREGKILPDHTGKNQTEKSQQSLEKDVVDKAKLFKQEFLDKLANLTECSDDKFKCAFTGECISKSKICDGKAQCADYSDEWNCFSLNNETNSLQVKREDKFYKVCATQWSTDLSNKVCNKMGYSGADDWKNNRETVEKEDKYLVVKGGSLEEFEFVESCADGFVEVECTMFECGSNSSSSGDSGEFSSISLVVNRDSSLRCTASIISPLWALTSAACVSQPEEWILIAGSTELNMSKISKNSVISLIGNIVTYPESDFALLELKQVLSFVNQIHSACLNDWDTESSRECLTTGWVVRESNNAYEKYEKIASVDRNCTTEADAVCVTPENKLSGECYNDKGSALYCYSDSESKWLLNGLQNRQNECHAPSVFAGLSAKTIQWIKNTVGNSRMFV